MLEILDFVHLDMIVINNEGLFQNSMRAGDDNLWIYFVWPSPHIKSPNLNLLYNIEYFNLSTTTKELIQLFPVLATLHDDKWVNQRQPYAAINLYDAVLPKWICVEWRRVLALL